MKAASKNFKTIIKATFPNYRKRSVYIQQSDNITLYDLNWSGGTKSEYRACTIDGRPIENKVNLGGPAPWDNPYEGKKINIPPGCVVVEGGHFCGKERMLYINFNPVDMPKQITSQRRIK